jgi:hypothetical protein
MGRTADSGIVMSMPPPLFPCCYQQQRLNLALPAPGATIALRPETLCSSGAEAAWQSKNCVSAISFSQLYAVPSALARP